jgi:hypothetical protein
VSCSIKPFLRTKIIGGICKQSFINCNWGCAYANGFVVLAEGLGVIKLEGIATGGRMIPSDTWSFAKETLFGSMIAVFPDFQTILYVDSTPCTADQPFTRVYPTEDSVTKASGNIQGGLKRE